MSTKLPSAQHPQPAFVVLPLAVITVAATGRMAVTFAGEEFPPPPFAPPWERANFGTLLDALTERRTRDIRIEVRESDGQVYTEIFEARRARQTTEEKTPQAPQETRRARRSKEPRLIEITATGFIPGEDITVAVIVTGTEGDRQGNARAVIDLDQLTSHVTEAVLIGDVSGHSQTVRIS